MINEKACGALILESDYYEGKAFNELYEYNGDDLGAIYTKEKTTFRVWAPFAEKMSLIIYKSGDIEDEKPGEKHDMKKDVKGTWVLLIDGDLNGTFYTYSVVNPGICEMEAGDPYAKAVGINGDRSAVIDLSITNPKNWEFDVKPPFESINDAVIYELHIRDLAMNESSGIINKGKFIEFTEDVPNTKDGITRGINHLKELGVTHVHLLPAFDYGTIDEKTLEKNEFNWGYDPKNYNVPEGSYSTDPWTPEVRIREFKEMVQSLHKNGLRVVMDVVYNHTNDNVTSKFHILAPGYYYRMNLDGTFKDGSYCGSETASECAMMRKYIVDSVKYWAQEYHVDGFRFDLMGLHDIETMNLIKEELEKIDKSIIVYGEGWDMGNLLRERRAIQPYAAQMEGISFFNDNVRDNIKGPWNDIKGHGFVDGKQNMEFAIMKAAAGSITYNDIVKDYNKEPGQSINYVECHDNNTLWDKLLAANPNTEETDLIKMSMLSNAIVLTSQGVPFLHAGVEFLRTKAGVENSFKSPDSINALDWNRKLKYINVFNYYKGLIELRMEHPAFRMKRTSEIREHLVFCKSPKNTVAYIIKNSANQDKWKNIFVIYNSNKCNTDITIPCANWNVVAKGDKAGVRILESLETDKITIPPISMIIMYSNDNIEISDLFHNKQLVTRKLNSIS